MSSVRNLVNLSGVHKGYATRTVLNEITLGVSAGDRIGVVGRNGEGKSTLLRLIAGVESPDAGVLTRVGDLRMAMLAPERWVWRGHGSQEQGSTTCAISSSSAV